MKHSFNKRANMNFKVKKKIFLELEWYESVYKYLLNGQHQMNKGHL